jgi:hypothetical protein
MCPERRATLLVGAMGIPQIWQHGWYYNIFVAGNFRLDFDHPQEGKSAQDPPEAD